MGKILHILLNSVPVLVMISLIPIVKDDYMLALFYILIISISLYIKHNRNDRTIFVFGFCVMIISEYFFLKTGVETFHRTSLLGIMPIWLPLLWGYGFIAIKRGVEILNK